MNNKLPQNLKNFSIVQASGRQYILETGKWYDLNNISAKEEDIIKLQRVLLHKKNDNLFIGKPCIQGAYVLGILLQNFQGKKTCIFKYKPKKKYTRKKGYRALLSRVLIKKIFEKK